MVDHDAGVMSIASSPNIGQLIDRDWLHSIIQIHRRDQHHRRIFVNALRQRLQGCVCESRYQRPRWTTQISAPTRHPADDPTTMLAINGS
jgi:hypothetical protein